MVKLTIEEMQEIAKSRGGMCLSKEYINAHTKLKWQCAEGHVWKSRPYSVKQGYWCIICAEKMKLTIEEMQEIAESRGGLCLSKKYVNNSTKLKWQCAEGHVWEAAPGNVKQGSWCPFCAGLAKLTIEEMRQLAESRGGKCLSNEYVNRENKLKWQCAEGHAWEATSNSVKQGRWCPICAGTLRLTIEEMQKIAESRGGKCLSKEYVNNYNKLKWQCAEGHVWKATPNNVKQGSWCPFCAGKKKLTIEEMQELAESRGGKCLSKKYINAHTKLKWQCAKGHIWEAAPSHVKQGNWCIICAGTQKLTIEEMQELAESRGGKCLSKEYIGAFTKLKWQCAEGHVWESRPYSVKQGHWCPKCSHRKKIKNK